VVPLEWPAESTYVRDMIDKVDVFVTNAPLSQLAAGGLDDETVCPYSPF
jgi:hypothetical protein